MASPSSSSSSRSGKSNGPRGGGRPSGKPGPAKGTSKGGSKGGSGSGSGSAGRGSARPSSRSSSESSGRPTSGGKPSRGASSGSGSSSSRSSGGSSSGGSSSDRTGSGRPSRPSGSSDRPRSGSAPSPRARSGGDDRATRRSTSEDGWADGPALETPRSWGGVARRGAGAATGRRVVGASRAWRDAVEAATPQRRPDSARRAAPGTIPDEATDAERRAANDARTSEDEAIITEVRDDAAPAVSRSRSRSSSPRRDPAPIDLAGEVREQLSRAVGSARTERVEKRLAEAAEHFESERYGDAARILKKSVDEAPTVAAVHELYGLTLYRQEKWKPAARELEAFRLLSNSTDQHPVLADCYRAMRQWAQVGELWDELRAASPSAELVTEGRIVMAGSLADRDDLAGAIALLEQSFNFPKRPMPHHLRRAYVLADLYERSGDLPKARTMFGRIENIDPDFADVRLRVRALR